MPTYKLIYFNGKGLAELPRLLFAMAGVEYEDFRMADREEFLTKYKPISPTGQVPMLEVDGKRYVQTNAITRYLAREFNLYGKNNLEAMQCDSVVETMTDIRTVLGPIFREQDESKKAELLKKAVETDIPLTLAILEEKFAGDTFVGDSITVADISWYRLSEILEMYCKDIVNNYPKLKAIAEKVAREPNIAAWLAKRPVTPF